jgi:beta-glucanase (GH16 family)
MHTRRITTRFILCAFIFLLSLTGSIYAQEWKLVWSDEFNAEGKPDSTNWNYEQGFVRNEELQWYQADNANCKDGLLIIEGRREEVPNPRYNPQAKDWRNSRPQALYTSSSITSRNKKSFLYGRFEVRARIPLARGSWPAIWTLGNTMEWPSCGEIDIMEYYLIKGVPHILANAAWGGEQRYKAIWDSSTLPLSHFTEPDPDWGSKFHIWRMDWDEQAIKLYLDDELLNEIPLDKTTNGNLGYYSNPFKQEHYILLNLALGSNGGEPDDTAFPLLYEIDYVRVYQKQ